MHSQSRFHWSLCNQLGPVKSSTPISYSLTQSVPALPDTADCKSVHCTFYFKLRRVTFWTRHTEDLPELTESESEDDEEEIHKEITQPKGNYFRISPVHLFPNCWDKMVGPTLFGSRHCKNVGVGKNFGPSVGGTFGPFVGPTVLGSFSLVAPTPTILNCRSQKLLGPTLLPNKREKGFLIKRPHKGAALPPLFLLSARIRFPHYV